MKQDFLGDTSFEAWHDAGRDYALRHPELDLWEFQIKNMSSDFAWRMEGCLITLESIDHAYADWISGNNPYSVHTIPMWDIEQGYDRDRKQRRDNREALLKVKDIAFAKYDIIDYALMRLLMDVMRYHRTSLWYDAYKDKDCKGIIKAWLSGKNPYSPHFVPLDQSVVEIRQSRRSFLKEQHKDLSSLDFMFDIEFSNAYPNLSLEKNYKKIS